MAGSSNAENIFNQLQSYNPTATNRWNTFKYPFNSGQQIQNLNRFTDLGKADIQRQGSSNVANARSSAGARATAGGFGGAIAEDMISGAGERAGSQTTNALTNLEKNRLNILPQIMNNANREKFNVTNAASGLDLSNITNMLQKFGLSGSLGQAVDQQPGVLSDIFAALNAASNVAGSLPLYKWI